MSIFKAYDVRGVYGKELTNEIAYRIGKAIATYLEDENIYLGWDMRESSQALRENFVRGVTEMGKNVIETGLVCSDAMYFLSHKYDSPAVMITASHNPKEYNGFKFCKAKGKPLAYENGLNRVEKLVQKDEFAPAQKAGLRLERLDLVNEYISHVRKMINVNSLKKLNIAADAGNGMAGKIVPLVFKNLPCKIHSLYFELDGNFPNHPANPAKSENLSDLRKAVLENQCDFGMAFDGDADRIVIADERGEIVDSSLLSALISEKILEKHPNESIVYSLVCSDIVPETIESSGGKAILEKVGHSFIKQTMRKNKSVFGCEASAHYYYRENAYADSAMITALIIAELVSISDKKLSELISPYRKYHKIEETNFVVEDKKSVINKLKETYESKNPEKVLTIDGLRVDFTDWWFCVRASNTEPKLRLNLEAKSEELMKEKTEELVKLIKAE